MAGEQIFIVEDEKIVAEDLKRMLERMGYKVVGSVSNGDVAIKEIETAKPDLVLMDIRIQGSLDGIDVAEHVYANFNVPVVYLTAYADETTVDRAKGTLAAGYILKPFEERALKTAIELALYRHNMEKMILSVEERHGEILGSLGMAVMATDTNGNVFYMNKTAEELTGLLLDKVLGKSLDRILISDGDKPGLFSSRFFVWQNGQRIPIKCEESVIKDRDGKTTGTAFLLMETNSEPSANPSSS